MFKYILVPSTASASDEPVLQTALAVARMSAGHICVLDVRPDISETIIGLAPAAGPGYDEMIGRIDQQAADRQEAAERAFRSFCEGESLTIVESTTKTDGPSAELIVETGNERSKLVEYGRTSDLVVLGRFHEDAAFARIRLEAAIMDTGRPVLIAPDAAPVGSLGTVAVAWKDTVEAAKAVTAALPFIERADRVLILSVEEEPWLGLSSATRLLKALSYHNASTTVHSLALDDRPAVETLLDRAKSEGVGLLVMGAYGHSRLREWVLGGFTRHVLNTATPPILMTH